MTYVTRQLYQDMQVRDETGDLERRWRAAWDAYKLELDRDKHLLPLSMQAFAEITLHDGVVEAVEREGDVITLVVDASNNPWGPTGRFEVKFLGVVIAEGLDSVVGDDWLYEEVHLHPVGFEYQVLLFRSEIKIIAAAVEHSPLAG